MQEMETLLHPNNEVIGRMCNWTANAYSELGNFEDAIPYQERCIQILEEVYPPNSTQVLLLERLLGTNPCTLILLYLVLYLEVHVRMRPESMSDL